jgi:type II secretory pathway component PulM
MSALDSIEVAYDRAKNVMEGLTPRDRALLAFLTIVFLAVGVYFAHGSMAAARKRAVGQLAATQYAQAQVDSLLSEYNALAGNVEALDARLEAGRGFAPLTWLEQVGKEMEIESNIRSIQERGVDETDYYRAQKIDIVVDDVDLKKTVELLHRLESAAQAVRVVDCRVKTERKDRTLLDLRLQVAVLKPLDA